MPAVDAGIAQKAMTLVMAFFVFAKRSRTGIREQWRPARLSASRNLRVAREEVADLLFVA